MKKRIYLSIIYFITLICIIIGVLGNVFNISPFTRMTMASSGKYIENSSIYDNMSDISIDMNLGSVKIKKGSKLEVIYMIRAAKAARICGRRLTWTIPGYNIWPRRPQWRRRPRR